MIGATLIGSCYPTRSLSWTSEKDYSIMFDDVKGHFSKEPWLTWFTWSVNSDYHRYCCSMWKFK